MRTPGLGLVRGRRWRQPCYFPLPGPGLQLSGWQAWAQPWRARRRQGSTYTDTNTGHAKGQDGSDGDDDDDEDGERDDALDRAAPTPTPRRGTPRGKTECLPRNLLAAWAPSLGSGLTTRTLPLHGVRAQRCGHLVLFRTKSRPRPLCGSPVPDMSRNKRGYLQRGYLHDFTTRVTAAFKGAATKVVYVTCVLVFVMHACLCLCRLLQRDQHDATCLFVFVMHARSCLCRLLQPQCRKEDDIDKGDGRSSRSLHGGKQPLATSTASFLVPPSLVLRFAYNRDASV
jgi:hypothetical protein